MNEKIKDSIEKMGECDISPHLLTVIYFLSDKVEKMEEEIEALKNTTVKSNTSKNLLSFIFLFLTIKLI